MSVDDIYRSSTQFKQWSFTPKQLADLRNTTNDLAAARVRASLLRSRESGIGGDSNDVDTLTVDEEMKIIEWGSGKISEMGDALKLPRDLIATAIQYLRRFYLTNSPMTYHPKSIIACALFLATKSEHFYIPLSTFVAETNVTEDDVKAPEFLVLQGIKFTLDVRHPFKGVDGGWMEMKEMIAEGRLLKGESDAEKRCLAAIGKAKGLMRREAQMTDVYFLFTPSQIWMAAVLVADEAILRAFLEAKFDLLREGGDDGLSASKVYQLQKTVVATVERCAELLRSYKSPEDDKKERKELGRIGKKLAQCQDPERTDIVAVARAKRAEKREGSESEREERVKKRKMEQEKLQRDGDVFGGSLRDVTKEA